MYKFLTNRSLQSPTSLRAIYGQLTLRWCFSSASGHSPLVPHTLILANFQRDTCPWPIGCTGQIATYLGTRLHPVAPICHCYLLSSSLVPLCTQIWDALALQGGAGCRLGPGKAQQVAVPLKNMGHLEFHQPSTDDFKGTGQLASQPASSLDSFKLQDLDLAYWARAQFVKLMGPVALYQCFWTWCFSDLLLMK